MTRSLAFLSILGILGPKPELIDPAKGIQLSSRLQCNGITGRQDDLRVHATFSSGGAERKFEVSRNHDAECPPNVEFGCIWKNKAGWRAVWSAPNAQPAANGLVTLDSCHDWGSKDAAQYVLTAWYKEGTGKKAKWEQVAVKQTSTQPEVFEFSEPGGGTGRLEIHR